MSATKPTRDYGAAYGDVQRSPEFQELRSRLRSFVFPMTAAFLAWYFLYVALAAFFPAFMSHKLVGNINVGLVFGFLQFLTTFAITIAYVRWADRVFDPRAARVHQMVEQHGLED
ncbi:DUF485 domain-containing protein [Arsenicicoccus dermatophilus]|uniref:DUF485 domain-containing protein n=1 Tax=Arsenicicoccus dermatophilus TaxID=1076331 RepID=UPI0039173AF2